MEHRKAQGGRGCKGHAGDAVGTMKTWAAQWHNGMYNGTRECKGAWGYMGHKEVLPYEQNYDLPWRVIPPTSAV